MKLKEPAIWLFFPSPPGSNFSPVRGTLSLMPKLQGFFDCLPAPENLSVEQISSRLGPSANPAIEENELANHIVYSQVVPVTIADTRFYLAVLCEALQTQPAAYYNPETRRIYILESFLRFIPDLEWIVEAYRDAFALTGVVTVSLKSEKSGTKDIGTFLRPAMLDGEGEVEISTEGKRYKIPAGTVGRIPTTASRVAIEFTSATARLQGKEKAVLEVSGGDLGIMVDARRIS